MLSAHCPQHGRTVFVPMSRIEAVSTVDGEHLVRWRCSCGTRGTSRFPRPQLPV